MTILDVNQQLLIEELGKKLKEIIERPEWTYYVKTSPARDRPPIDDNWYYYRAASILRKIYLLGPIGVSKLSRKYGGRKNRGFAPEHFYRGSKKIIRVIMQELEKKGFIKRKEEGQYKGRIITPKGEKLLAEIAKKIKNGKI